ncbi:MAG: hypothetical protein WC471_05865 [Candidatus Woesearchaeota archaeon]
MKYLDQFVKVIKQKPELNNVDEDFVRGQLEDYIQKHVKLIKKLEESQSFEKFQQSKEYDQILKTIRGNLRKPYGLFQIDLKERDNLFNQLRKDPNNMELHKALLRTHRSTSERIDIYPRLYEELFQITKKPKSILDLSCGLNPLSLPWMGLKDIAYTATELSEEDLRIIKTYFSIKGIRGRTIQLNLIKDYAVLDELKADVCFMFKLLDSLETIKKDISQKILERINAKYIVASFSTKTVGGKQMRNAKRVWFEHLAENMNFKFKLLEYQNELFYILEKV